MQSAVVRPCQLVSTYFKQMIKFSFILAHQSSTHMTCFQMIVYSVIDTQLYARMSPLLHVLASVCSVLF
jgi:hypothetical protein